MIRAALCWLLLLASAALAQSLPALYDVTGVSRDDTLNLRAGPSIGFQVIGKLQPGATGIEVVDTDSSGDWGLINIGERPGWVALRYLVRAPGQPAQGPPRNLSCSGTEPFWSFGLAPDRSASLTRLDGEIAFDNVLAVTSENRPDRHALFADGGDIVVTAMVGRNLCSDAMSERAYGLGIDLLITEETGVRVYSGCCSVAP